MWVGSICQTSSKVGKGRILPFEGGTCASFWGPFRGGGVWKGGKGRGLGGGEGGGGGRGEEARGGKAERKGSTSEETKSDTCAIANGCANPGRAIANGCANPRRVIANPGRTLTLVTVECLVEYFRAGLWD